MDDEALAVLEHENFIAAISLAGGQSPGADVHRARGVAVILTGHPLLLFNQIFLEDGGPELGALEDAVGRARERGHRFIVDLRIGQDDAHVPRVRALGLVPLDEEPWIPGMALHPIDGGDVQVADEAGFDIRQVTDERGVEDHIVAASAGFEMDESWLRSVVGYALVDDPTAALYVGYVGGAPVVSGLGVRTGRTIGVYNIATAPVARRQGRGRAMTARVVADGAARGCDVAILQASDMGRPIYERMGFRTVVDYMGYVDPRPNGDGITPGD